MLFPFLEFSRLKLRAPFGFVVVHSKDNCVVNHERLGIDASLVRRGKERKTYQVVFLQ